MILAMVTGSLDGWTLTYIEKKQNSLHLLFPVKEGCFVVLHRVLYQGYGINQN